MAGHTARPARRESVQTADAMITVALALLCAVALYEILAPVITLLK